MKKSHFNSEIERVRNLDSFSVEGEAIHVEKPWGSELIFTGPGLPYTGKLISISEGARLSLQVHDKKQESWILASGSAYVELEDSQGEMQRIELTKDKGYFCALGQKHRLVGGKGGGTVFEVSTPELGTTYRLEDDYSRDDETEKDRSKDRES